MYEVEHILSVENHIGESPQWNIEEQALYWIDLWPGIIYRYKPDSGLYQIFNLGIPIGAISFRASGGLVLATKDGFATWDSTTGRLEFISNPESDSQFRFNDGKVDRQGRFWAGTMIEGSTEPVGSLYRLDPDLSVHTMDTGMILTNGIGWSPDNGTMYYNDTLKQCMYAYDFNATTGAITNRRIFIQYPPDTNPDGLTVDSEGYIWCALCKAYKVVRYAPSGVIDREIQLPGIFTLSCIFGGKNLDELYVTTGWLENREKQQIFAGDLFRIKTDVKGLPEPASAG